MDKEKLLKIKVACEKLKVAQKKLISTYQFGYLGIKTYDVVLNNGKQKRVEQITKGGISGDAVVVIPITVDHKFVMVIESRPNTINTVEVSFPAGMIDKNEEAYIAAQREVLEETGYRAAKIQELEWHYQDAGCSQALIHTFVAYDCVRTGEPHLDTEEALEDIELSYEEIWELLNNKMINGANSKIALMSYDLERKRVR